MEQASVLLPAHIDAFHLAVGQEPGVIPNCLSLRPGENVGGRAQEVAGAFRLDTVEVYQFFLQNSRSTLKEDLKVLQEPLLGFMPSVSNAMCSAASTLDKEVLGPYSW